MENNAQKIDQYKLRLTQLQQEQQQKNVELGIINQNIEQQKEYFRTNFGTDDIGILESKMIELQNEISQLENNLTLLG